MITIYYHDYISWPPPVVCRWCTMWVCALHYGMCRDWRTATSSQETEHLTQLVCNRIKWNCKSGCVCGREGGPVSKYYIFAVRIKFYFTRQPNNFSVWGDLIVWVVMLGDFVDCVTWIIAQNINHRFFWSRLNSLQAAIIYSWDVSECSVKLRTNKYGLGSIS